MTNDQRNPADNQEFQVGGTGIPACAIERTDKNVCATPMHWFAPAALVGHFERRFKKETVTDDGGTTAAVRGVRTLLMASLMLAAGVLITAIAARGTELL
jgi:hypothetical protein